MKMILDICGIREISNLLIFFLFVGHIYWEEGSAGAFLLYTFAKNQSYLKEPNH